MSGGANDDRGRQDQDEWRAWHDERERALASEYGWLTLVSLDWLDDQPRRLEHFPGQWAVVADPAPHERVRARFAPGDAVTRDGEPVSGAIVVDLDDGASDMTLGQGGHRAEIIRRGGMYAVRVRDSNSALRRGFTGVPTFPYDPAWRITAHFTEFTPPVEAPIGTAQPGLESATQLVGQVSFDIGGSLTTLRVGGAPDRGLTAVFHDATNGRGTAAWRSVATPPVADDGSVVLDFNRATCFPAAFTDFGTCPMPPEGNTLDLPVRAGERDPRE